MFSISELGFGKYESQRQHSEVAGKLRGPVFGGSVEGHPKEGEGQQELSVLAPFMWEQSLAIFNFGAVSRDTERDVGPLRWLGSSERQCLVGCGRAVRGRGGPATAFSPGTIHVGGAPGCF